ncbi:MAG: prepilin-type N-terminal cleavage/methylation domain-containing protein [bacterium]|nr:prepilin-type N-terminal cleavage/methylation domain-containing protein [bacterium]
MKKGTWGFTFIEIIVVTTIIGLLMSGAAVSYSVLTKNARDAKRKTDLETMRSSLELYKSTYGVYPIFYFNGLTRGWSTFDNTESQFKTFMSNTFPQDPKPPTTCIGYLYTIQDAGQKSYTIYTVLENTDGVDATQAKPQPKSEPGPGTNTANKTLSINAGSGVMCQGTTFNYWINSP